MICQKRIVTVSVIIYILFIPVFYISEGRGTRASMKKFPVGVNVEKISCGYQFAKLPVTDIMKFPMDSKYYKFL